MGREESTFVNWGLSIWTPYNVNWGLSSSSASSASKGSPGRAGPSGEFSGGCPDPPPPLQIDRTRPWGEGLGEGEAFHTPMIPKGSADSWRLFFPDGGPTATSPRGGWDARENDVRRIHRPHLQMLAFSNLRPLKAVSGPRDRQKTIGVILTPGNFRPDVFEVCFVASHGNSRPDVSNASESTAHEIVCLGVFSVSSMLASAQHMKISGLTYGDVRPDVFNVGFTTWNDIHYVSNAGSSTAHEDTRLAFM